MKTIVKLILVIFCISIAFSQENFVDIGINSEKNVITSLGFVGLPTAFGSAEEYKVILRISQLKPGQRYEATITYDAEPENSIHYAHAWVDGNPYSNNWHSFVGIATGTGTNTLKSGRQEKFIFTIDSKSTSNTLYIPLRSNKPFTFSFSITDKLTGVNRNSIDRWGETYVKDFDENKAAPFLLTRDVTKINKPEPQGQWVNIDINSEKTVTTALGLVGLSTAFGSAEEYKVVLRILNLKAGQKYEATITYDAEPDNAIHYAHSWVDGNPYTNDWYSFIGIATGTGTREFKSGRQEKFIFSIDSKSNSNTLYIPLKSNKQFTFRFSITDKLTGVNPNSIDKWGETYVKDFDENKAAPFLLKR